MKKILWPIAISVALGVIFYAPVTTTAQTAKVKPDLKAPPPRLSNGKPDFSGVWARPGAQDLTRTVTNANGTSTKGEPNPLPFTPWGQAQWDNYDPIKNGDYAGSCMPFGWIRSFTPHPMQITQNNEYVSFLFEQSTMFQVVNTEGLPHRNGWSPTWFGDSRGRWDGDTLVIEAVNFNGWTKLDTLGHPMSSQAKLTMTFKRPDFGHIQFKWVLDDPRTYTRTISNDRVFVLTPEVEIMEYACMENNLTSLLQGAVSPWTESKDQDANLIYGQQRNWNAYDQTAAQKFTGVIREETYNAPFGSIKMEVDKRNLTVILAPPPRMDFRGLTEAMLKPGATATFEGYPSKQTKDEFRAITITVGRTATELR